MAAAQTLQRQLSGWEAVIAPCRAAPFGHKRKRHTNSRQDTDAPGKRYTSRGAGQKGRGVRDAGCGALFCAEAGEGGPAGVLPAGAGPTSPAPLTVAPQRAGVGSGAPRAQCAPSVPPARGETELRKRRPGHVPAPRVWDTGPALGPLPSAVSGESPDPVLMGHGCRAVTEVLLGSKDVPPRDSPFS